jgi:hypothetical protein
MYVPEQNPIKKIKFCERYVWLAIESVDISRARIVSKPVVRGNYEQHLLDHSALCNLQNVSMNSSTVCAPPPAGLLPSFKAEIIVRHCIALMQCITVCTVLDHF